jgi:hypothetical protein
MHEVKLSFDIQFGKVEFATDETISAILEKFPDQSEYMQLEACKILIDKLPVDPVKNSAFWEKYLVSLLLTTFDSFG